MTSRVIEATKLFCESYEKRTYKKTSASIYVHKHGILQPLYDHLLANGGFKEKKFKHQKFVKLVPTLRVVTPH